MDNRQYGIPSGYQEGSQPHDRGPVSPLEVYNPTQSYPTQDYAPPPATRSPPRKPVAPYARKPVAASGYSAQAPPSYQDTNQSYNAYQPQLDNTLDQDTSYSSQRMLPPEPQPNYQNSHYGPRPMHQPAESQSSIAPLAAHGEDMAGYAPTPSRLNRSGQAGYGYGYDQPMPGGVTPYQGDGYDEIWDPRDIADDGDDGLEEPPRNRRTMFGGAAATGAGAGAAAGGSTMLKAFGSRDASGNYGPVPGGGGGSANAEKSEWLRGQRSGNKRLKWIVGSIIVLVIVAAVAGGLTYYFLHRSSSSGPTRGSAADSNGLWGIDSSEVQSVLNNGNLHKVFPGMDYTPLNAQYPACLSNMPYQNDVTLDVAVLAQLTPAIRLYGTDCKQTEMVLKGIDLLGYNETVKVWLGVWLDGNSTTSNRQLKQMYDILETYPSDHFAGIIVGNEVLFSGTVTETQLGDELTTVRSYVQKNGLNLPVATSDLGDNWNSALAADSDIIMANVHPFFAGVKPDVAPGWTWSFWDSHDVPLTPHSTGKYPRSIISETGWPSEGGNDCGGAFKCPTKTEGAIAGIDELNTFLDGWVCPSMANGTTYFWFEAFDEPWKEQFDDPKIGNFWEPHWGLMDVNRNLKSGVKIPDCDGKTIDTPY